MQFSRFSTCGLLIILVFWLNVTAAVPPVLRPAEQVLPTKLTMANGEKIDVKDSRIDSSGEKSKTSDSENWDIPRVKEKVTDKCANEAPRENQTYTRSIPNKSSSDPADDFKIAGEARAKKTSSVHSGEEIALCWIETTTIKEDPESNPPRRLVIREFAITFENSASIPASYLDCNELEGEISPGDEETVKKSALHEVIDENTKKSRELNFTRVTNVDGTIVRQHKKVKCGVGAVVTKDIFQWPDGTDNPKKRVEIKVGPSIRDLDAPPEDKPGECASKSAPKMPQSSQRKFSSPGNCTSGNCSGAANVTSCEGDGCTTENSPDKNTSKNAPKMPQSSQRKLSSSGNCTSGNCSEAANVTSCEGDGCTTENSPDKNTSKNAPKMPQSSQRKLSSPGNCTSGNCSEAANVTSCEGDGCTTENAPDKNAPTAYPPDSNEILSTGVIRRATTMRSTAREFPSPSPATRRPERVEDVLCLEGDVDCISAKATTVQPANGTEKTQNCSSANRLGGSTDRSTSKVPCDPSKNSSCLCTGKNCSSIERSTSVTENVTETTTIVNELCKNGSESPSCSSHRFKDAAVPQSEDKKAEKTTMDSANGTSGTTTESSTKPSTGRSTRQKDSNCDKNSGECLVPLPSDADENPDGIGNKGTTSIGDSSSPEPSREQNGNTEVPNVVGMAKLPEAIGNASRSLNGTSCDGSGPEGCSTVAPGSKNSSVGSSSKVTETNETRRSSSCAADDESCKNAVAIDESVPVTKPLVATTESSSKTLETETIPPASEKPVIFPNRLSDEATGAPIARTDPENSTANPKAESKQGASLSDEATGTPITRTDPENSTANPKAESKQGASLSDEATGTPITRTDPENSTANPKAESKQGASLSDEASFSDNDPLTLCSADSDRSGGCSRNNENTTVTPSPADTRNKTSLPPSKALPLTLPSESCDSSGSCGSADETFGSDETNPATSAKAGERTKNASNCDDSVGSCESPASSSNISDNCEDGSADCRNQKDSPVSVPCDSASGSCSLDASDAVITTKPTPKGLENSSPINSTVATTAETRRSIGLTTPLSTPGEVRHRLALRIKVLLEHIDENKEREQLVQVERHLLLNEKPNDHGNHSLTLQLQTLNNSMNFQTLKDILNCTVLENLSKDAIDWDRLSKDAIDVKEVGRRAEGRESLRRATMGPSVEGSVSKAADDDDSNDKSMKKPAMRKKREISKPLGTTAKSIRPADVTKEKAILKSLPGVQDDLKNGVDRILARIARELEGQTTTASNSTTESSSSKILKILSDPSDRRVHSKRPKRAPRVERTVSVRQLSSPVNGEEIERWSNERFVSAADGGQIRSLTEFRILRDHSGDSRTDSFGFVGNL